MTSVPLLLKPLARKYVPGAMLTVYGTAAVFPSVTAFQIGTVFFAGMFLGAFAFGRIADRIAPFLGVQRRADVWRTATGERVPTYEDVEGDGR